MKKLNVLIVDDHHLMVEGYKSILSYNPSGYEIEVAAAHNCEQAFRMITGEKSPRFDMIFLDLSLPPAPGLHLFSGQDLVRLAKKHQPKSPIAVLTSHAEGFVLYDLIKSVNPSGVLVKSDFTADELLLAFDTILNGETYYSLTVRQHLQEIKSKEMYLDHYNRQIILLLSQGIKTKNLPEYLPLSISAIDKRKVQIKEYFNFDKSNDEDILREAKKAGLI